MNKTEIAIVGLLVALLLVWGYINRRTLTPTPQTVKNPVATNGVESVKSSPVAAKPVDQPALPQDTALRSEPVISMHESIEQTAVLSNAHMSVVFTSWGAAVSRVELQHYRQTLDPDSAAVRLDFSSWPALAVHGYPDLSTGVDFDLKADPQGSSLHLQRTTEAGLRFDRFVALGDGYTLAITDRVTNVGATPLAVPVYAVGCGPMTMTGTNLQPADYSFLGLDSLAAHGGEGVRYWMKTGFMKKSPVLGLFSVQDRTETLPTQVVYRLDNPVSWLAAKNKFFAQILAPEEGSATGAELHAWRDPALPKGVTLAAVAAAVAFPENTLQPGETSERSMTYYVGPKKYTLLRALGQHQVDIMEFGTWFGWICKLLLPTLNGIYAVVPNYGVAIILLTFLVRIVFWPVTHKSTEDMKRLQKIQPLVNELRAKFKDKPQKMNQEVMALYKEHKVNPMSGCLPMLIQIPVFIALFTVLRSAIELRFAPFLWIGDLSEPERLFAGTRLFAMLPLVKSLNLLPLIMTATTIWQQKLTPTTGDPQQQKIMMWMPVFMLFLFYNMASALVLYWTTSQFLSIVQLLMQRRKAAAGQASPTPA